MNRQHIIMTFTKPPSADDLLSLAGDLILSLPEECAEIAGQLDIVVEDFPDDAVLTELDVEDPFELLALFRHGSQIHPSVLRKNQTDHHSLHLYRRPILDMWCESGDDLSLVLHEVILQEIAQSLGFSEEDIEEMRARPSQLLFAKA